MIDLDALVRPPFPLEPTPEAIGDARSFALVKWQERHDAKAAEYSERRGEPYPWPRPEDLSSSCKFTSVFAAVVFGGDIEGNYDHQYAVVNGDIVDLNDGAGDVAGLDDPYEHDPEFFGSPDHRESMLSCLPRIEAWLEEYAGMILRRVPAAGL